VDLFHLGGAPISMKQALGILFLTIVSIVIVEMGGFINKEIPRTFLFGLSYNLFINGLVYLLGAFKTFRLPVSHYKIKRFEKQGRVYKIFGVDYVRRVLKFSGAVLYDGKRSSLEQLEDRMLFAEKNHTICFVLNLITMAYLAFHELWELIPSLLFFNLLLNIYPIITQRYNRARIQIIQGRLSIK
jgi:hypothetical protein